MSGEDIAAEIDEALREAAAEVGGGKELLVTFEVPGAKTGPARNPTFGDPTYFELPCIEEYHQVRDATGTLTGVVEHRLSVSATGPEIRKGYRAAIGVAKADADKDAAYWTEVDKVNPTSPGGVALIWEVVLRD